MFDCLRFDLLLHTKTKCACMFLGQIVELTTFSTFCRESLQLIAWIVYSPYTQSMLL